MAYLKSLVAEPVLELRSVFPWLCFFYCITFVYSKDVFGLRFSVVQRHEFPSGSHCLFKYYFLKLILK